MSNLSFVAPARALPRRLLGTASQGQTMAISATPWFLWLLTLAALTDWLVTRTITRVAIFIPKTPAMIGGYQVVSWLGQTASTLAALLALVGIAWLVREAWQARRFVWLSVLIAVLAGLSLLFLVMPPGPWLLLYHGLAVGSLFGLGWRSVQRAAPRGVRIAGLVPALAMAAAALHQAGPTLYAALGWAGPPAWGRPLFLMGEVLVVAGAFLLWWAFGRGARRAAWLWAGLPVLLFAAAYLATPAMTATIVIWSNGLTLFLPWWLYAAALWLLGVAVLQTWRTDDRLTTAALLLLASAGYAPQLSSQFFCGLLALWLLGRETTQEAQVRSAHNRRA